MEFNFNGPQSRFSKREKLIFIPRFVKAVKNDVVINDLDKHFLISANEIVDLFHFHPLKKLEKSHQLQQALKMRLIEAEKNQEYL